MSKRKTKEKSLSDVPGQEDAAYKVPSVPSTAYLQPRDVHLASLFSTHRPISITSPIPNSVAAEQFASIFLPRTKNNKNDPSDVIYTLSSAVKVLDNIVQQRHGDNTQSRQHSQVSEAISHMRNALAQGSHVDGQNQQDQVQSYSDLKLELDEVAKTFTPFNPPPAPVPIPDVKASASEAKQQSSDAESEDGSLEFIVVRRPENGDTLDSKFFSPPYYTINEPFTQGDLSQHVVPLPGSYGDVNDSRIQAPSATSDRRVIPRRRVTVTQQIIHAISVKRQRKLKMKKHKYKKLMRRTRNLRRKLDQL